MSILIGILGVLAIGALIYAWNCKKESSGLEEILRKELLKHAEEVKKAREDALVSARNTLRGQVNEELMPLFPDFPYNFSDCKFSGAPIDYIVYHNMSAIRDGNKEEKLEVILAEVKMNKSKASTVQKAIKEAVDAGRVRFETWRIHDNKITIK